MPSPPDFGSLLTITYLPSMASVITYKCDTDYYPELISFTYCIVGEWLPNPATAVCTPEPSCVCLPGKYVQGDICLLHHGTESHGVARESG